MDICNAAKGIGKLYLLMLCKKKTRYYISLNDKKSPDTAPIDIKCNQVLAMINATLLFK